MNIRAKVTRVDREDYDPNVRFDLISPDGECRFWAIREDIVTEKGEHRHGNWILYMHTPLGGLEVDRDQYSNDLTERVEITISGERAIYGHRFKAKMDKASFHRNAFDYVNELEFAYGGEWVAEYYDWEGKGVFCRKAGT